MLKTLGHSGFSKLVLELGLPDSSAGSGSGLEDRATSLAKYAIDEPAALTAEGQPIGMAIATKAIEQWHRGGMANITQNDRQAFANSLAKDGIRMDEIEGDSLTLGGEVDEDGWTSASITFDKSSVEKLRKAVEPQNSAPKAKPRKVFLVHGHDDGVRESVARFLEKIKFDVVILHEQANKGRTVIEKFEQSSDVGFAIVILTPDDVGSKKDGLSQPRARQNVILEWGYFIGQLGRDHVCALKHGEIEMPSDIIGIVWEPYDSNSGWKAKIAKELQAVGYEIDWQKVHE